MCSFIVFKLLPYEQMSFIYYGHIINFFQFYAFYA